MDISVFLCSNYPTGQPQLRQAHSILLDGSRAVSVHVSHVHTEIDAGGQEVKFYCGVLCGCGLTELVNS